MVLVCLYLFDPKQLSWLVIVGTSQALRLHKRRSSALPLTTVCALVQMLPASVLFTE